jgi:signal transduction histidine kinase
MPELLKVLVIDDEPGMRTGIARALRDCIIDLPDIGQQVCFEVLQSGTAEKGYEIIQQSQPNILLLDHKLPGMTGLELLKKLELKNSDMLVIMITAYASVDTAVEATKNGAYDFLAKPFAPAELKNMLQKASGRLMFQRQARKLAEEKKRLRFEFISVLTHELKSPLAAVEGYLNIIKNRDLGDNTSAYEHIIDRSLIRLEGMKKLIFDLLDLTRIESKQKKREITQVEINPLVQHCIETANVEAQKRGIVIKADIEKGIIFPSDANEIEIILNNLLSNAVKYNRDNGRVDMAIKHDSEKLIIKVSDTGIGMTEEESAKLFNDFVRIKNIKTHKILGSGLGLSVVKKLALLYNGSVSVESQPDVGSTFTVELGKVL